MSKKEKTTKDQEQTQAVADETERASFDAAVKAANVEYAGDQDSNPIDREAQPEEPAAPAVEDPEPEPEKPAYQITAQDKNAVYATLLADGWDADRIAGMIRDDPAGTVAVAKSRADKNKPEQEKKPATVVTDPGERTRSLERLTEPLRQLDEHVPGISEKLGQSLSVLVEAMAQELHNTRAELDSLREAVSDGRVRSARKAMQEEGWRELADDANYSKVFEKFTKIRGNYDDQDEAFRDAVYTVLGADAVKRSRDQSQREQRESGQPTVRASGGAKTRAGDDPTRAAFDRSYKKNFAGVA